MNHIQRHPRILSITITCLSILSFCSSLAVPAAPAKIVASTMRFKPSKLKTKFRRPQTKPFRRQVLPRFKHRTTPKPIPPAYARETNPFGSMMDQQWGISHNEHKESDERCQFIWNSKFEGSFSCQHQKYPLY